MAVLLVLGLLGGATWPASTLVQDAVSDGGGQFRCVKEMAIRQDPTYIEAFIAYSWWDEATSSAAFKTDAYIRGGQCTMINCSAVAFGDLEMVGPTVWGIHLLHPSLAIAHNGVDPTELTYVRNLNADDCDGDDETAQEGDLQDQEASELWAYDVSTDGDLAPITVDEDWKVSVNYGTDCDDRGRTSTVLYDGQPYTCYTFAEVPGTQADVVRCNDGVGRTFGAWVNDFQVATPVNDTEDHASLDFVGSERIVLSSDRDLSDHSNDRIRYHHPDTTGTPSHAFTAAYANHPDVNVKASTAHLVYSVEIGANAEIRYRSCPTSTGCLAGDWSGSSLVAAKTDARYPEIVVDTDEDITLVAFMAKDGTQNRVWWTYRCGTGSWSAPDLVMTPGDDDLHQSIEFGEPVMVMNTQDEIIHIAMLDEVNATSASTADITRLYWNRMFYGNLCP